MVSNLKNVGHDGRMNIRLQEMRSPDFEGERIMTKRLYYADSYLKEFSGTVLECRQIDQSLPSSWTRRLFILNQADSRTIREC